MRKNAVASVPAIEPAVETEKSRPAVLPTRESELARSPWFAGNAFSAADIQMSFPLEAASVRAGLDQSRPTLMDFLQRIHSRPAYKRALERGGQYDFVK